MNTPILKVFLAVLLSAVFSTEARKCRNRILTNRCEYFVKTHRDSCKWEEMKTNCALTCKVCVPTPKCATMASRYGCCWDNKTEAKSYAGEGCPECNDNHPSYCRERISQFTREKACNERGAKMCPKSCGVCKIKAPAQALPECLDSPHGCCWDLTTAQGPGGEGCRVCMNLYTRLCSLWDEYCQPEAYRFVKESVIDRYRYSCPVTCGKCTEGQKKLDISAYRRL